MESKCKNHDNCTGCSHYDGLFGMGNTSGGASTVDANGMPIQKQKTGAGKLISAGINQLLSGIGNKGQNQGGNMPMTPVAPASKSGSNAGLYIGIALAIAVIVIVFIIAKRKK